MANTCFYSMKIKGSKENCQKWIQKMRSYEEKNHFRRFFTTDIYETGEEDGKHYDCITGDCAWSIRCCCITSETLGGPDIDLLAINSRDLELDVEIYSEESGMDFAEHFIYKKGKCCTSECEDLLHFEWDKNKYPTFEEYVKCHSQVKAKGLTEEDFFEMDDNILWAYVSPYAQIFTI